jgi:ketosteroid isomerase-like protein
MSQEDVEIVRSVFQAFEQGDLETILSHCDEDIEITQAVELIGASRHQRGHAGVLEAFAIWPEQWDDYRVEILHLSDLGEHVLAATVNRGRGKDSGVEVEMPFTFLFTVHEGKITRWRLFMHEEQALEAAKLAE